MCPFHLRNGKISFLDGEISEENDKFVTIVYRKTTFNGVYTHFESFLPSTHKSSMLYTLVYRCFTLCSDWTKFHRELITLKEIFQRNSYPTSCINKCFKNFLDRLHIIKSTLATVEKKSLCLVLPYVVPISLQVRTKNKKYYEKHCQVRFLNTLVVDTIFPTMVRQRDT